MLKHFRTAKRRDGPSATRRQPGLELRSLPDDPEAQLRVAAPSNVPQYISVRSAQR
jgi:hypothetical protein